MPQPGKLQGRDEEILAWMNEGKSRKWIAEQCQVTPQAISLWKTRRTKSRIPRPKLYLIKKRKQPDAQ